MEDIIPQTAIDSIAQHINQRTNKQYNIPTVGDASNPETPQIFEIILLDCSPPYEQPGRNTWRYWFPLPAD